MSLLCGFCWSQHTFYTQTPSTAPIIFSDFKSDLKRVSDTYQISLPTQPTVIALALQLPPAEMPPFLEFPLCVLNKPISLVAATVGATLEQWAEPGLGPAQGFSFVSQTNLLLRAEELADRPSTSPRGFTIYVPAEFLASHELEFVLGAVLAALSVDRADLSWLQSEEGRRAATEQLARLKALS